MKQILLLEVWVWGCVISTYNIDYNTIFSSSFLLKLISGGIIPPLQRGIYIYGMFVCCLSSSKSLTSWAQKLKQNQPKRVNTEEVQVNSMQGNEQAKKSLLENVSLFLSLVLIFNFTLVAQILFLELCVLIQHMLSYLVLSIGVAALPFTSKVLVDRVYFLGHPILINVVIIIFLALFLS